MSCEQCSRRLGRFPEVVKFLSPQQQGTVQDMLCDPECLNGWRGSEGWGLSE